MSQLQILPSGIDESEKVRCPSLNHFREMGRQINDCYLYYCYIFGIVVILVLNLCFWALIVSDIPGSSNHTYWNTSSQMFTCACQNTIPGGNLYDSPEVYSQLISRLCFPFLFKGIFLGWRII